MATLSGLRDSEVPMPQNLPIRLAAHSDRCRVAIITSLSATLVGALAVLGPDLAQAQTPIDVAPGVYALMGQEGEVTSTNLGRVANIAFVVGPRGVVVVDSGVSLRHGQAIIAAVRRVTRRPIRLVVITHPSQEVVFGSAAFRARGIPVLMHRSSAALMAARCERCLLNLTQTLGSQEMAGSRIVQPDRMIDRTRRLDLIGRPITLIASVGSSAPGALSVLDETTGTLMAGSVVSIDSVPDMRDSDGKGWTAALAVLKATNCAHLVPAYGKIGSCADIGALERYFAALEARVRELLGARVSLAELPTRCEFPEFAVWDRYAAHHVPNANRAYLRLERSAFD